MTDIAEISWSKGMTVEGVKFKPGSTQGRDEFGSAYINFDTNGKIVSADGLYSGYHSFPQSFLDTYAESLKTFSGLATLNDITLLCVNGQMIAPFLNVFGYANEPLLNFYNLNTSDKGIVKTLPQEKIPYFEAAVRHLERALHKPLGQPLTFDDLIQFDNPLYSKESELDPDRLELFEEVRYYFQTKKDRDSDWRIDLEVKRYLKIVEE